MHMNPEQIQNLSWLEAAQRSRTPKTPKTKTFGLSGLQLLRQLFSN
jgi:hypothetical protein